MSQIDITVYLVYYLVSVFIVSFDNVIYTCCHLAITSVFSRAALPIMGNKQLHVKWPRALLRFISVRLENPNKIAIAILSSTVASCNRYLMLINHPTDGATCVFCVV